MASRLKLTRAQLADFLKDFESIRQFELLFAEVNKLAASQEGGTEGGTALAMAGEALATLERLRDLLELIALAPPDIGGDVTTTVVGGASIESPKREDNSVATDYIDLSTTGPVPVSQPGRLHWDEGEKTALLGLSGGNVELHVGQEEVQSAFNGSGVNLAKGVVVTLTGAQGNRVRITRGQANTEATSIHTFGFTDEAIANGAEGFVINSGLLRNVSTINDSEGNALSAGDTLYLSTTIPGGFTKVKPSAPNHFVIVGFVVRVHAQTGSIFVKVDNGYEIDELHDVLVTAPKQAGQLLIYDDTLKVWKNARLTQGANVVITNGDGTIEISATHPTPLTVGLTADDVLQIAANKIEAVPTVVSDLTTQNEDQIVQEDGSSLLDEAPPGDEIVFYDVSKAKLTYLGTKAPLEIDGSILQHAESGVVAGTYGSATQAAQVQVNAEGHVTSAVAVTISGVVPSAHASTHQHGGTDEVSTSTPGPNEIPKALSTGKLAVGWLPVGSTTGTVAAGDDPRLSDARVPTLHGATHRHGGGDEVATATAAANAIPKATGAGRLAAGWMPAFTGDVTTSAGSTATTLANSGVAAGTYNNVTVNAKGLATAGSNVGYLTGNQTVTLSGDVTGSGATSIGATIANEAVTFAKMQNVTAPALVGRDASGAGVLRAIGPTDVKKMVGGMIGAIYTLSSGSGTITLNPGIKQVYVEVVAGGGGGGAAESIVGEAGAGGGGGGGGYASDWYILSAGVTSLSYQVGAGGAAGTIGVNFGLGGNGVASWVKENTTPTANIICEATGGSGGAGSPTGPDTRFIAGGDGGLGLAGGITANGNAGSAGIVLMTKDFLAMGGQGGGSHLQGSRFARTINGLLAPGSAVGLGGGRGTGGGGAVASNAVADADGGPGGAGIVRVVEYY